MNFSGEGSEEVRKLKKQLHQQDFRLSHLQTESQKCASQIAALKQENVTLRQSCDSKDSSIVQLEAENVKIREERDRQKVVHTNLEQALQQTKTLLQGTEKDKRLLYDDKERELERKGMLAEKEADTARERCRMLEEQLRSAHAKDAFEDTARRKSGDSDAKIMALQKEIDLLKASPASHQDVSSPTLSRAGVASRRPRSSSVSGNTSPAVQELRETLSDSVKEVEQLKARAAKAEKEALKASNEKLALSRSSETIIADLRSKVADLEDELSFLRDNQLKKMEEDVLRLQGDSVKTAKLETDLQFAQARIQEHEAALRAAQESVTSWQGSADQLREELRGATEDVVRLQEQLLAAEQVLKQLNRRDREVESAKKRIGKLSLALRKMLLAVTNGQASGDETHSQSILVIDESSLANVTTSNEYEANLVDEIDQLMSYVDEADGRVEFAKVERGIQESSAANRIQDLERLVEAKEQELNRVTEDRDHGMTEQAQLQARMEDLMRQKREVEHQLQDYQLKLQTATSDNTALFGQIESLREELLFSETKFEAIAADKHSLIDTVTALKDSQADTLARLVASEAEVQRSQIDSEALQQQIADLKNKLQNLQATLTAASAKEEDMLRQMQILETERDSLSTQYTAASDSISLLERRCQEGDLSIARSAMEVHHFEVRLHDEARQSSERQAILLHQSLDALHTESKQWCTLVAELRHDAEQSLLHLESERQAWTAKNEEHTIRIAALEAEAVVARAELQDRNTQIGTLQLDLQAGRTNQQLAEDALKALVSRESDSTVLEDVSNVDVSTELYELRLQLDQAKEALESSKRERLARENDLAVTLEEAKELKTELSKLDEQLKNALRQKDELTREGQELRANLLAAEASNREMQASVAQLNENLSSTMRQMAATQNTVGDLEATRQALELEKRDQLQQYDAVREELREAQEGYTQLKEMMESRNAEYWETKEELAEWQERYERSQNDVKIKDDLEERLREAVVEMNDAKRLADEYLARCTELQESASLAQKEVDESRLRFDSLEAEVEQSKVQATKLEEVGQQLATASTMIERLEHDLAQKAQECEDADDKELALRKDNKKLGARLAATQARLEKLQSEMKTASSSQNGRSPGGQIRASGSAGSIGSAGQSAAAPTSVSRKRRAPEDEEQSTQNHPPVLHRAIYAPAPKLASSLAKEATPPMKAVPQVERTIVKKASLPSSTGNRPPKSPNKLQDRTNLLHPRHQQQAVLTQDSHFLTKLNKFRPPPSIHIETASVAPS